MHIKVKSEDDSPPRFESRDVIIISFQHCFSDGKSNMTQLRLSMIKEVAHGIKGFFDAFVGTQLLYNNERVS